MKKTIEGFKKEVKSECNLPTMIDDPEWWKDKVMPPEEILRWFSLYECGWSYEGEPSPERSHVELSGEKCSNAYYDCRALFGRNPRLCAIFADQLARKIKELRVEGFNCIAGSAYSAITFSFRLAEILRVPHVFTEKDPNDPKKQIWNGELPGSTIILQVEELITTSRTFREVRRAIQEGNPESVGFLAAVGTLIHCPPKLPVEFLDYDGIKVISLVEKEIWAVEPKDCPLCKIGSPRYRPKTNWAKLTGKA